MNNDDEVVFYNKWADMADMQTGRKISDGGLEMAFNTLKDFSLQEVLQAMQAHCRTNKWVPAPSEIIERIVGVRPTVEAMAGLARNPDTVLGVYLHQKIGSHAIQTFNDEQLLKRVKTLQNMIGDFIDRAQYGDFTDTEIRMFAGRGVDPSGRLCRGLRGPAASYREVVRQRYQAAIKPKIEHEPLPEMSEQDAEAGKAELAKLMKTLGTAPAKPKAPIVTKQSPEDNPEKEKIRQQILAQRTLYGPRSRAQ